MNAAGTAATLAAAFACAACTGNDPLTPDLHDADEAGRVVVAFGKDTSSAPRDPFRLDSAAVRADTLHLYISTGGGCEKHEFALLAIDGWLESHPVQARLDLAHDANGDLCRALLHFHLRYDLAPLARAYRDAYRVESDSVILRIPDRADINEDVRLLYRF